MFPTNIDLLARLIAHEMPKIFNRLFTELLCRRSWGNSHSLTIPVLVYTKYICTQISVSLFKIILV